MGGILENADLSKHFAWDGDRLITEDAAVINKLRRKALSPSTAKSMKSCVARWAAEKVLSERVTEDPFDPAPLGTSGHALFEEMYGWEKKLRSPEAYHKLIRAEANVMDHFQNPEGSSDAQKMISKKMRNFWISEVERVTNGLWKIENPAEVDIYGLETKIENIDIDGVPVIGFIDRIAVVDGVLSPEDYKTGKKKAISSFSMFGDDHGDQLRVYSVAIAKMFDVKVEKARVLYTDTKAAEAREVNLKPRAMKKTIGAFVKGWEIHNQVMDEGVFPTETGPLCGWCPLVNTCPAAEAGDYVDAYTTKPEKKTSAAPSKVALGIPTVRKMGQIAISEPVNPIEPDVHTLNEVIDYEMENNDMTRINDYQVLGISGLQSASFKVWERAGVANPSMHQIKVMTRLARFVTAVVQRDVFGGEDLGAHGHTRLRGFFFTTIEHSEPAPVDGTAEQWSAWTRIILQRTNALAEAVMEEYVAESPLNFSPDSIFEALDPNHVAAAVEETEVAEPEAAVAEPAPETQDDSIPELPPEDDDFGPDNTPVFAGSLSDFFE